MDILAPDVKPNALITRPRCGNADGIAAGGRGRGLLIAGAFSFLSLFAPAVLSAQSPKRAFNELEVKIVFLFNFTQFVEWPPGAFPDAQAPLVVGILGQDPFGRTLDQVVRGEKARNRAIIVERYQRVEDVKQCHLLFISSSEGKDYERIFGALERRPILTVGDTDGFARRGGMMRFLTENNRLRLRVNLKAAQRAGVSISSNLLRPAEIVESEATR